MKRILIFTVVASFAGICSFIFLTDYAMSVESQTVIGTAKVDWLPHNAKNVSQKKSDDGYGAVEYVECSLPEADFLVLAKRKEWGTSAVKSTSAFSRILKDSKIVSIQSGFRAESRGSNGSGYTVVYDRVHQYMYYEWSSR